MFAKSGGAIAATATLALLTVTAPVLAASGPAPPAGDPASPAAGTPLRGIDVAAFQHPRKVRINWAAVAGAGYKFAAVKATEGNYYVNPWTGTDLAAAKKAGLYVTAYHFAIS